MKSHRFDFSIGLVLANIGIIAINSLTLVDAQEETVCINQDYDVMAITIKEGTKWLDNGRLQQINGEWKEQEKVNRSTSLPQPIAYGNKNQTIIADDKILWRCLNVVTAKWLPTAWTTIDEDRNSEQQKAVCTNRQGHVMMITMEKSVWGLNLGRLQQIDEETRKQQKANPASLPKPIAHGNLNQTIEIEEYIMWQCVNLVTNKRPVIGWTYKKEDPQLTCTDQDHYKMNITVKKSIWWLDNGRLQQIYEEWKEQKKAHPTSLPQPIAYGNQNQTIEVEDNITWRCLNAVTNRVLPTVRPWKEENRIPEQQEVFCVDKNYYTIKFTVGEYIRCLDIGRLQQIYEESKNVTVTESLPKQIAYGDESQHIATENGQPWKCLNTVNKKNICAKLYKSKPGKKFSDPPPNPLPPKIILGVRAYEPFEYLVQHFDEARANHQSEATNSDA